MNILVSACLLGKNVKYNGLNNKIDSEIFESILSSHTIFAFCPEVEGGLSTPRAAAEIKSYNPLIIKTNENIDVTDAFLKGAKCALMLCKTHNIQIALLKSNSPSCSNEKVYDGNFSGILVDRKGVTAEFLIDNAIQVFNENQLKELNKTLNQLCES